MFAATGYNLSTLNTTFFRLFLLAVLVNIMTQAIHETGHTLVYQIYRRNPTWGFIALVQLWDVQPLHPNDWVQRIAPDGTIGWLRLASSPESKTENLLEAAAGPLASLAGAIAGLWIAYKNGNAVHKQVGLMLSLATSFVMTAYYLRSPFRIGGDEFDIASQSGLSKGMIEAAFGFAFVLCFLLCFRLLGSWRIGLKWFLMMLLGGVMTGIGLNIADQWVRIFVNQDNLFFQSVLGYSLPVLVLYLLTILGIFVWEYKPEKSPQL